MATGARTDEQLRADVERALREAVTAATALPSAFVGRIARCTARTTSRLVDLVPPLQFLRSALDVTLANVTAPVESSLDGAAPTAAPAPDDAAADDVDGPVPAAPAPDVDGLPIDEYESLAASQVVARLTTLTPAELDAVREFEAAHRGRRTVLGKIDQLRA